MSIDEIQDLKYIHIVSNTPLYLFKNFKSNSIVQNLSKISSTKELIDRFNFLIKNDLSADSLTELYAIIVALTMKDSFEAHQFFMDLDKYDVKWFNNLKNIYLSILKPTQEYVISQKVVPVLQNENVALNHSDTIVSISSNPILLIR